ncbi:MAG: 2-C-methyl-D-erythritol 4-phosphate cytidylyltransferase [Clostridiales bacterium]|jgi:2-C-methyl-D-erythritol 4-phosphate cytidylyltransferase|nr:2-C-methyl-D-erythritol 4-phosphate cytidylyltransferase [Clostridiales bacterium]
MVRCIGVVLAGGEGARFGGGIPKQFVTVAGKTILEHTVDLFEHSDAIDEVAIVMHPQYINSVEKLILGNCWRKVTKILPGGEQRRQSTLAAVNAYDCDLDLDHCSNHAHDNDTLIFHDAARPLLNPGVLLTVKMYLDGYDAVNVVVPATDTILVSDAAGSVVEYVPDRSRVYHTQTPQAFRLGVIRKAYEIALRDPDFNSTDDCGVVAKYLPGVPVKLVMGNRENIKLTYPEDLEFIKRVLMLRASK